MNSDTMLSNRPARGSEDLDRIYELVKRYPENIVHVADLPWELTAPEAAAPGGIQIWEDGRGDLCAYAHLWGGLVDHGALPDRDTPELWAEIIKWARGRLCADASCWNDNPKLYSACRESDASRREFMTNAGFSPASWCLVHLRRLLEGDIPAPPLPNGFSLRPLRGKEEVEAYVQTHRAAFDSTAVTFEWRSRTLLDPNYCEETDIVAISPDGRMAAFAVCWPVILASGHTIAQVEPMGVHPDFRGMGLGRAVLCEGFQRLQRLRAESVDIEYVDWNGAAKALYESVGFVQHHRVLTFEMKLP
ncbi:MAG: hypothetical protein NVSMB52_09660 [Chloroflexota bacterium]